MFLGLGLSLAGTRRIVAVPAAPVSVGDPIVSGTEVTTQTLSVTNGDWTAYPSPSSYTYQWQRDTAGNGTFGNITDATNSTYLLTTDEVNDKVRCRVAATNASGSATASSNTTGFIALADTTPLAFSFTDVTGASLSTVYTSNSILVTSVNLPTAISISGAGTYSINGGAYTSSAGTVVFGDSVTVRITSAGAYLSAAGTTLTIGGVSDTYSVTTSDDPSDDTPDQFIFTDITDAALNTVYTSNSITVSGINVASAITVSGGTYSINGGAYTASAGTVVNGNTVTVRGTSSASYFTNVHVTLTIGGVNDVYTVRTLADPAVSDGSALGLLLTLTKGSGGGGGSTAGEATGLLLGITKSS
jgi:hypothetical protein